MNSFADCKFSVDNNIKLYILLGKIKHLVEFNSGDKIPNVFTNIECTPKYFDRIKEIINEILDIIDPSKDMRSLQLIDLMSISISSYELLQESYCKKDKLLQLIETFINILREFDFIELVWCIRFIISDFYFLLDCFKLENNSSFCIFVSYYITFIKNIEVYFDIFKQIIDVFLISTEKFNRQDPDIINIYTKIIPFLIGLKNPIYYNSQYQELFIYILSNFNYYYDCRMINFSVGNLEPSIRSFENKPDKITLRKCLEYNNNFFKMNTMSKIRVSWITAVYHAKEKRKLSRK
jgi:hypothetical protein